MNVADLPDVCTIVDVAAVMRFDGDTREQHRKVYDLVKTGALVPIGGVPAGKLTKVLRFSRERVRRLIEGEPLVTAPSPDVVQPPAVLPKRRAS